MSTTSQHCLKGHQSRGLKESNYMKNTANSFQSANLSGQPQKGDSNKPPQGKVRQVVTSSAGKPGDPGGSVCMVLVSE